MRNAPPPTVCLRYLPLHPQVVALLLFGGGVGYETFKR